MRSNVVVPNLESSESMGELLKTLIWGPLNQSCLRWALELYFYGILGNSHAWPGLGTMRWSFQVGHSCI